MTLFPEMNTVTARFGSGSVRITEHFWCHCLAQTKDQLERLDEETIDQAGKSVAVDHAVQSRNRINPIARDLQCNSRNPGTREKSQGGKGLIDCDSRSLIKVMFPATPI